MNDTESADKGLAAIESLASLLDAAQIEYWLFGGWAVDFWVGQITRPHDDIDAAAWRSDYNAIRDVLTQNGWKHAPTDEDVVGTRYTLDGAVLEFTFLEQAPAGEIVIPIPENRVVWSAEPFGRARRMLGTVTARVIPLALLREGKARPRTARGEAAKDRADYQALASVSDRSSVGS
jgi:hypothetical protein